MTLGDLRERLEGRSPGLPVRFEDQDGLLLGDVVTDVYVHAAELVIALDIEKDADEKDADEPV